MHFKLSILALALTASMPIQAADTLDPAALREAEVTLREVTPAGAAGKAFIAGTIINAPMATLCAIVQDYASYPGFMPSVSKTVVTLGAERDRLVDMTLKLPLGKVKKYRLQMTPASTAQQCRLAWKMVPTAGLKPEETIADTTGYWLFTPAADPARTTVRYYVHTDPGPVPLGAGWIVDSMSKDSLPKTLEALRTRAGQR
jgi:ribosome-associated toxin RatA of RatAB toxin-antitoxin module